MPAAPAAQKVAHRAAAPAVQRSQSHRHAAAVVVAAPARSGSVQRAGALRVSSPSDPAEREAERTAQRVVNLPESAVRAAPPAATDPGPRAWRSPYVARFAGTIARRAPMIARKAEGEPAVTDAVAADIAASRGSGAALPPSVRRFMEPRFGASFAAVRVHTGDRAKALSRALGARAFTVGDQVFFAKDQFQPESPEGRALIAHELTHTIQQGAAVQRRADDGVPSPSPAPVPISVSESSPSQVQRAEGEGGFITSRINALAYNIPGFRMFTIVLGTNPITGADVDRSPANILRAIVEFLPGGHLIVDALDNYGIFDKVGGWVAQQIASLGMVGSSFANALTDFIKNTSKLDLLDPIGLWQKAKRIFTDPVDRLIAFVKNLALSILQFIRDAILMPLAPLAKNTRGYDLLCVVLGKDPVTNQPVAPTAENLIGGFMKFIGQEEVWTNAKNAHAGDRLLAWFQSAMAALKGFVQQIPTLFINALKALEIADLVLVTRAFQKLVGVFGDFASKFFNWGLNAVWNLLEIVFDVVSPGALAYIKKTGAALKSILKNPIPFVLNLVAAAKLGLQNFAANFLGHLKAGLIDWLTGALEGVYIPKALSLAEIGKFVLSVLGISWANIRAKFVKAIGATGEVIMTTLEKTFDVIVAFATGGAAAAWEKIKEYLNDLKDMVIGFITDFVVDAVVKKAIPKLVSLFIPGAGFVSAIISIYDTIMVFVQKLAKIAAVVKSFVDSIVSIANGVIGAAAARVESTLAGLLSLAISFLAGFIGLGNVAAKINGLIAQVRGKVDKAIDTAVNWIVAKAKALFARLFGKKDKKDDRTDAQKAADLASGLNEAGALLAKHETALEDLPGALAKIRNRYKLDALDLVTQSLGEGKENVRAHGAINPVGDTPFIVFVHGMPRVDLEFNSGEYDKDEYSRQIKDQETGLRSMKVAQWRANRDAFLARAASSESGRHPGSESAQRRARRIVVNALVIAEINRQKEEGKPIDKTAIAADIDARFAGTAVLHAPDQIAGGEFDKFAVDINQYANKRLLRTGEIILAETTARKILGNLLINSSIGSQWKQHAPTLDARVAEHEKNSTPADLQKQNLNARLSVA
jgi:hypothetical protein